MRLSPIYGFMKDTERRYRWRALNPDTKFVNWATHHGSKKPIEHGFQDDLDSFVQGAAGFMVLGKRFPVSTPPTWQDAINTDASKLWDDMLVAMAKIISELPSDKRVRLQHLLEEHDSMRLANPHYRPVGQAWYAPWTRMEKAPHGD